MTFLAGVDSSTQSCKVVIRDSATGTADPVGRRRNTTSLGVQRGRGSPAVSVIGHLGSYRAAVFRDSLGV